MKFGVCNYKVVQLCNHATMQLVNYLTILLYYYAIVEFMLLHNNAITQYAITQKC